MDKIKIGDGEIKIMEYIWNRDSIKAGEIVQLAQKDHGWSKNTTYTMLKRLVEKGMIQRRDPGFHCYALVAGNRCSRRRQDPSSTRFITVPEGCFWHRFSQGKN